MPLTTAQTKSLADAVVLLLGVGDDDAVYDQAKSAVGIVTTLTKAYTRGVGFSEGEDGHLVIAEALQGVIITAAARLTTNPQQTTSESESSPVMAFYAAGGALVPSTPSIAPMPGAGGHMGIAGREGRGPALIATQSVAFSGGFHGFTDVEKAVLHQFRIRNG